MNRDSVKRKDERFWANKFIEWHAKVYRSKYHIENSPESPDFVVRSSASGKVTWLEITGTFANRDWAIDLYTYACADETYKPMANRLLIEPDREFAKNVSSTLMKKLRKISYNDIVRDIGPGYLVVGSNYPLFTTETLVEIQRMVKKDAVKNDRSVFRNVYIGWRQYSDVVFRRLKI